MFDLKFEGNVAHFHVMGFPSEIGPQIGGRGGGGGTGPLFLAKRGVKIFKSSHKNSTHREKEKKGDQRGFLT